MELGVQPVELEGFCKRAVGKSEKGLVLFQTHGTNRECFFKGEAANTFHGSLNH